MADENLVKESVAAAEKLEIRNLPLAVRAQAIQIAAERFNAGSITNFIDWTIAPNKNNDVARTVAKDMVTSFLIKEGYTPTGSLSPRSKSDIDNTSINAIVNAGCKIIRKDEGKCR